MIRPTCPVCNVPMLMRKQIAGNGTKQIGLKQSGPPGNRSRRRYANITTIYGTTW